MNKIKCFLLLVFISVLSFGQNTERKYILSKLEKDVFIVVVNDGVYNIRAYSSNIVETMFKPVADTSSYHAASHAVVIKPNFKFKDIKENDNTIELNTSGVSVKIQKIPFQISYTYKGKLIISEKGGYIKNDSLETIQFNLTKDEALYGGGARALGMNRRGNRLRLYNKAHYGYETRSDLMNFTLPIVLSSNRYMIHFDNAPIGFLDLDSKKDNTLTYETISGRKAYQIIADDSWYNMLNHYTDLTGKQPMPPRWALGNFSSRFGYHSQEETEATIKKFKTDSIPVDAIILDLYWFGKEIQGTMGNLEVYRDSFPDFEGMVSRLKDKNVKTIAITEPFILSTSKRWDEAVNKNVLAKDSLGNPFRYDFYFGNTGLIDIYKPEGEKWFWDIYKKEIINKGIAGIWGDLGEPEVHPKELLHAKGTANEVHNIYGHDWARLVYEGYLRDYPEIRPFILMRAGYSGSQRYGLIPWSGDVNRTWGGLQSQPEIALQMGMQGLGYMHSDLGGFAGANLDDELYVRWLQYGVFQPIYRPHAQEEVPSEPVYRSDIAKQLAKQAIELRYKLLPYNYNLVYENNQYGKPLMRPLLFEEIDNLNLIDYSKTYLWGNDFLVSPILKAGVKKKEIYFPKEHFWFNLYTDKIITGGQTKEVKTKENSIPTYVRAGAFIPMAKPMQSTEEYDADTLELHYYHHPLVKESERKLYNDNGKTLQAYEKGMYEFMAFEAALKKRILEIKFEGEVGENYRHYKKSMQLVIHNIENKPKYIKINGKPAEFIWNSNRRIVDIPITWITNKKKVIKIKLER